MYRHPAIRTLHFDNSWGPTDDVWGRNMLPINMIM